MWQTNTCCSNCNTKHWLQFQCSYRYYNLALYYYNCHGVYLHLCAYKAKLLRFRRTVVICVGGVPSSRVLFLIFQSSKHVEKRLAAGRAPLLVMKLVGSRDLETYVWKYVYYIHLEKTQSVYPPKRCAWPRCVTHTQRVSLKMPTRAHTYVRNQYKHGYFKF